MTSRPTPRSRRIPTTILLAGGVAGAAVVVGAVAWAFRFGIAEHLAAGYLLAHGAQANLRLTRVDLDRIEGSVLVGPAIGPTLRIQSFTAELAHPSGLFAAPMVRRIVLVRPELSVRFDGRQVDFGPLQSLVDQALKAKPGPSAGPDIDIRDGRLTLASPYGAPAHVTGAATIVAGLVQRADLTLQPAVLRLPGAEAERLEGRLRLTGTTIDSLAGALHLAAAGLGVGGTRLRGVSVDLSGTLPNPMGRMAGGGANLAADFLADRAGNQETSVSRISGHATFEGTLQYGVDSRLDGSASARFATNGAKGAGVTLDRPDLDLSAALHWARREGLAVRSLHAALRSPSGRAEAGRDRASLSRLVLSAKGGGVMAPDAPLQLALDTALSADVAADPHTAQTLARRLIPGDRAPELREAVARVFGGLSLKASAIHVASGPGGFDLALEAPLTVSSRSRAKLVLASGKVSAEGRALSGAVDAALSGGGLPSASLQIVRFTADGEAVSARFKTKLAGSAGLLRDLDLQASGSAAMTGSRLQLTLDGCAPVSLGALAGDGADPPLARALKAEACPAGGPLLVLSGGRWRVAAQLRALQLKAPGADLAIEGGEGLLALAGAKTLAGEIRAIRASVSDTASPLRFKPLALAGGLTVREDRVGGAFNVTTIAGHPLGRIDVRQDLRSGAGGLTLAAPALAFAPKGLQPAAVLPALAPFGKDVAGPADVSLALDWAAGQTHALAHARTHGLQVITPAGRLDGVNLDLTLTSLDPLVSAPDQTVTASRLAAVTPLTDISATFTLAGDAVDLKAAGATLAGGGRLSLDPMRATLRPSLSAQGVLNLDRVELGPLLESVNLSRALKIEARIKGRLPFSLSDEGLRLSDGRLAAMQPGRLTLNRNGLTGAQSDQAIAGASPSAMQDFAFQALENLAFSELSATVASRPQGRLGVVFHVRGRHDPPTALPARVGVLDLLHGKAFDKAIPLPKGTEVNLTLDSSLNLDDLLNQYKGLGAPGNSAKVQP